VARPQNHVMCRNKNVLAGVVYLILRNKSTFDNKNVLAGVVYLILRNKSTFDKSVLTTPAGKAEL